ncbi:MAG: 1-phosphofructokinase family hexose kinase [Novosphingobium sp.]
MKRIATLTLNPTIDASYEVDRIVPTHKVRTRHERYEAGGGGINVARVFCRLGGAVECVYFSGGGTGAAFDGLVDDLNLPRRRIAIAEPTRIASAVHETETGQEYRFVPAGPTITAEECERCLDLLREIECDYFVASGSLPPGVPADFYVRAGEIARARGIAFVLDTSGEALKATLGAGGVLLVKPSGGELRQFTGRELETPEEFGAAAMDVVTAGRAELVAVTLGHKGAVLARKEGTTFLPAIPIEARSAVGAGDSFLATMLFALASGRDPVDAFRYGMAGGAASVLTPGTGLAHPEDIERLFAMVAA